MVTEVLNSRVVQIILMVTVLLEYIDFFIIFYPNTSYYAGIMLDAFSYLLCLKLCWHNRRVPICHYSVASYELVPYSYACGYILSYTTFHMQWLEAISTVLMTMSHLQ